MLKANKQKVLQLAPCLTLSLLTALTLSSSINADGRPAKGTMTVKPPVSATSGGTTASTPAGTTSDATSGSASGSSTGATPGSSTGSSAGTSTGSVGSTGSVSISVPASGSANSANSDFEARIKAEALATEHRQNEAIQHYDASKVYFSSGNTEMAELELQAAIMDGPNIKAFHRDLCVVSILRGHPMKAVAEAMMVVGLGDPIPFSDKQIEKLTAQGCKLHYRRGLQLAQDKKWKEAITEFQWALEYRPHTAKVIRSMAFANANLGNIELAESQYGSSFAVDPGDAYGHADLAYILAETGNGAEAIKQLQEAVKLQPKVAALHIDLGWMAESKGNLGEAEGEFAEAVKLSPKHATLWTHLGKILARQGKDEQALSAYKEALALDPGAQDAQLGLESLQKAGAKSGSTSGSPGGGAKEAPAGTHEGNGSAGRLESNSNGAKGEQNGPGGHNVNDGHHNGGKNQLPPKYIRRDS